MSTPQVCDYLALTPLTVYRFVNDGSLPAYRFGRVIRFKRAEVDAFIESCRIEPGTLGYG